MLFFFEIFYVGLMNLDILQGFMFDTDPKRADTEPQNLDGQFFKTTITKHENTHVLHVYLFIFIIKNLISLTYFPNFYLVSIFVNLDFSADTAQLNQEFKDVLSSLTKNVYGVLDI